VTSTSDTNTTLTLRNVTTSSDVDGRRAEFAKTHHRALRHQSHDHLARRRGVASVEGPRLSITTPISQERFDTSAATVDLAGSAETIGETVTRVSWRT
jgi:hypothetical protein